MNNIIVKVLSAYQEYVDNGFPKDPAVYSIRANNETLEALKGLKVEYKTKLPSHLESTESNRLLSFLLRVDSSLPMGQVVFGPEVIVLEFEV